LSIQVVLASNDGDGVDGSLSGIGDDLRSRFGQYSRFQRLDSANVSISSGSSRSIGLPNGQSMSISFQGMSGSSYRLSVALPGGGTTVTAPRGGIFFVAGPSYDGGILIVAISIRFRQRRPVDIDPLSTEISASAAVPRFTISSPRNRCACNRTLAPGARSIDISRARLGAPPPLPWR
jgi:hypothetical protein